MARTRLNGWLRLWIVGSALLLIVTAWNLYLGLAMSEPLDRPGRVRDAAVTYLLWVIGALLLGYAVGWIGRGFARASDDPGAPQ
jgi:hypothetical protein